MRSLHGRTTAVPAHRNMTVKHLMRKVESVEGTPVDLQRFVTRRNELGLIIKVDLQWQAARAQARETDL